MGRYEVEEGGLSRGASWARIRGVSEDCFEEKREVAERGSGRANGLVRVANGAMYT